ncbi:MAG: choline kinase family protein [Woeseia sp.]
MTHERTVRRILAGIPGWQDRSFTIGALQGGLNNCSYQVDSNGSRFVLRIAASSKVAGGGSHALESKVQRNAAAAGLAAQVLYSDPQRGVMLLEYLSGQTLSASDLLRGDILQQLGELLRDLHALPLSGVNFAATAAAENYLAVIGDRNAGAGFARFCRELIDGTALSAARRCCHNDVIGSNLVLGQRLQLIDFEYACDNDPLFDLASVLCWHDLAKPQHVALLQAYAGQVTASDQEALQIQCRLYDALLWLWLAAREQQRAEPWLAEKMQAAQRRLA